MTTLRIGVISRMELLAIAWVAGLCAWLFIPALVESRSEQSRTKCLANLDRIGQAFSGYMTESDQHWPWATKLRSIRVGAASSQWPAIPAVLEKYLPADDPAYRCPSDSRTRPSGASSGTGSPANTYYEAEGLSYEWWWAEARAGRRVGEESISDASGFGAGLADQKVLSDFEPFHDRGAGGGFNVLFADFVARSQRCIPH